MRIKIAFYYSSTYKRESSFGQNSQNDARCRKDSRGLQLYSINTFDKLTSGRQRLPLIPRGSSEFQNNILLYYIFFSWPQWSKHIRNMCGNTLDRFWPKDPIVRRSSYLARHIHNVRYSFRRATSRSR